MYQSQLEGLLVTSQLPRASAAPDVPHDRIVPRLPNAVEHDAGVTPEAVRDLSDEIDRISRMIHILMERRENLIEKRYELTRQVSGVCIEQVTIAPVLRELVAPTCS